MPNSRRACVRHGDAQKPLGPAGGTARARQLTHFTDDRPIADIAWSRDGQRLATARTTTANDIVLFKGLKR